MGDICRLCLGPINGCDEILLNNNHDLTQSIFLITTLVVVSDPEQCEYLCSQCRSLLEQCVDFRQTCMNNDAVYHQTISDLNHAAEDQKTEFQEPIAEYIKHEPVDLGEIADDVKVALESNHELPLEIGEPSIQTKPERNDNGTELLNLGKERINRRMLKLTECQECGKMVGQYNLKNHQSIHNPSRSKLRCPHCHKSYVNPRLLKQHIQVRHTNEIEFKCDLCGKSYNCPSSLRDHYTVVHTDEKRYACKVCGEKFHTSSMRVTHIRRVHGPEFMNHIKSEKRVRNEPKVQCPQCDKLVGIYKLREHQETHNPNRTKARCPHCPKAYMTVKMLKRHILVEHIQYRFKCELCEKSYNTKATLNDHCRMVHTGEKKYPCKFCGENFTTSSIRARHIQKVHVTFRPFTCEYCDKSFKTKRDLTCHMRSKSHSKRQQQASSQINAPCDSPASQDIKGTSGVESELDELLK